jgi:hypothetical protein
LAGAQVKLRVLLDRAPAWPQQAHVTAVRDVAALIGRELNQRRLARQAKRLKP